MRVLVYGMVGTNRGGIETFLLKMNQYMSQETIFDYVNEEKSCLHEEVIRQRGGKIYYIAKRSENPIQNILENKKLLLELRTQIDAVYFNLSSLSWIFPIKQALNAGYRVYVHSHNAQFIEANSSLLHRVVNSLSKRILSKWNIRRLSCSAYATEFMFNKSDSVEMIYNAIKTEDFRFNMDTRRRIRKELGITDEEKIIGFVGRINDQKNPLYLPVIMNAISKVRSEVRMIILGDGIMRAELEKKIEKMELGSKCMLLGNRTNVNELMQAMDVFILPSLHEGLPYVGIEAQTSGLFCCIADTVTPEVNVSGNVKFLQLTENAENWVEAILEVFDNPDEDREKWADFVGNTNFNIKNEARRLEKLLGE